MSPDSNGNQFLIHISRFSSTGESSFRFESLEQVRPVLRIAFVQWLTVIIMDGIISLPLIKSQLKWGKVEFCISIHRLIKVLRPLPPETSFDVPMYVQVNGEIE